MAHTTTTQERKTKLELMTEKLNALEIGRKVVYLSRHYTVTWIVRHGGKLQRTTLVMLEDGKPQTEVVAGRFLAEGQTFVRDNCTHMTLYAQAGYMDAITLVEA